MKQIEKIRDSLLLKYSLLAKFLLPVSLVEDPTIECGATNGKIILYNPGWFNSLPRNTQIFFLLHENVHIMFAHHRRMGGRDLELWNYAADYEGNGFLSKFYPVPEDALYNPDYNGMNAEKIYSLLKERDKKQEQDKENGQGNSEIEEQQEKERIQSKMGEVLPGDNKDNQAMTPGQELTKNKQEMATIKKLLEKVGATSPEMGAVEEFITPKKAINDILKSFIQVSVVEAQNWSKPDKKFIQAGYYMPSFENDGLINVVCAIDKSYSLRKADLELFQGALSSVLEEYDTIIHVAWFNTDIVDTQVFSSDDLPLKLDCTPRGGTAYTPVFQWVETLDIIPTCLIVFTDLQCNDFPEEPAYPTLWVSSWKGRAPFGDIFYL